MWTYHLINSKRCSTCEIDGGVIIALLSEKNLDGVSTWGQQGHLREIMTSPCNTSEHPRRIEMVFSSWNTLNNKAWLGCVQIVWQIQNSEFYIFWSWWGEMCTIPEFMLQHRLIAWTWRPCCNTQLQTSFFKPKDSFMYPILDCDIYRESFWIWVTLVSPIVCIPEGYKDLQEHICRSSRNQSYWPLPNPTSVGHNTELCYVRLPYNIALWLTSHIS